MVKTLKEAVSSVGAVRKEPEPSETPERPARLAPAFAVKELTSSSGFILNLRSLFTKGKILG